MKLVVRGFLLIFSCVFRADAYYTIPNVTIKASDTRGIVVSLPYTTGDQIFSFHGNINTPIARSGLGEVYGDAHKQESGKWVIRLPQIKVKVGDKIHFWLYIQNNHLGYTKNKQVEEITEVYPSQDLDLDDEPRPQPKHCNSSATICERVVVNLTQNLLELQQEVEDLKERNAILTVLIQKNDTLAKTLTLEGLVVDDGSLNMIVQAIVKDKLDLPFVVEDVIRVGDKVEFRVRNVQQKLQVLAAAKTKLKHSRYVITP